MAELEWVTKYSSPHGLPYRVLEDPDDAMLPITKPYLDSVLYIYPTKKAAESAGDKQLGGSGFVVGYALAVNNDTVQLYAVTNRHVIERHANPAIRINTSSIEEEWTVLETNANRWVKHPEGDDLAAYPLDINEGDYTLAYFPTNFMLERGFVNTLMPGDEVFMVGRFASLEGETSNSPTVRFGNIARLRGDPIENKYGHLQESFLIDCRSIPGYSGSPVFVTRWPHTRRPPFWLVQANEQYDRARHGPFLLGIDWLHIPKYETVERYDKKLKHWKNTQSRVQVNTGLAGIIPAWRLLELLEIPVLKRKRDERDARLTADRNSSFVALD